MSFTNLNFHMITATKDRRPFVHADIRERLAKYIGGIVRNLGGDLLEANGPEDHFHMVAILRPTVSLSNALQEIKGDSSRWVHETFPDLRSFDWQDGYSAFTVSRSQLPAVIEYVRNQQEHHRKVTFEEELKRILELHQVDFDPRYLMG